MALLDLLKFVTSNSAWGTGKGSPLDKFEHDGNTYNLAAAIQNLIDNPVAGVSVSNIAVSGRQVTFYMTDSTTYGPFNLPIAQPRFRDAWVPATSYSAFDIVTVAGYGTYIVATDHTSEATFNPDATSSDGDYYVKIGNDTGGPSEVVTVSETTLTLTSAHAGKYLRFTNAGGCTVTVPDGVFADNQEVHMRQVSGDVVLVAGSTAVVINPQGTDELVTGGAGSTITLKHITNDEFDVMGKMLAGSV